MRTCWGLETSIYYWSLGHPCNLWFYLNSTSTVSSRHLSWFLIFAISLFSHWFNAKFKIEVHAWFQNPRFKNSQLFILFKNLNFEEKKFWLKPENALKIIVGRSRPTHVMSQKEKEELELKEMKMNQFHAKAVGETLPRSVGLYFLKNFFEFFFFFLKCKRTIWFL